MTDVVIIGGGPSGSFAGINLLKKGYSVIIIDAAIFPRKKLCGGIFTKKSRDLVETTIPDFPLDKTIAYTTPHVRLLNKKKTITDFNANTAFDMVDRTEFDFQLIEEFKKLGGVLHQGVRKYNLDMENNTIQFGTQTVTFKYLIGADGANSKVRKLIDKSYKNDGFCMDFYVPKEELPDYDNAIELFFNIVPNGYAWVISHGETVSLGFCDRISSLKVADYKTIFEKFCRQVGYIGEMKYDSWPFSYGRAVNSPVKNNLLLVGDAAGLLEPITCEGIYYALYSGKLAADAIEENITGADPLIERSYLTRLSDITQEMKAMHEDLDFLYSKKIQKFGLKLATGHDNFFKYMTESVVHRREQTYKQGTKKYFKGKIPFTR
jgi:geranylgeranyl reductase family protein